MRFYGILCPSVKKGGQKQCKAVEIWQTNRCLPQNEQLCSWQAIDRILSVIPSSGSPIADIGSGTGIFAKEFLSRGYEVFGVEPKTPCARKPKWPWAQPFHSVCASAEDTSLPAGRFSLVTATSAFHWFDPRQFRAECRRILTFGGIVCLVVNARVYDASPQSSMPSASNTAPAILLWPMARKRPCSRPVSSSAEITAPSVLPFRCATPSRSSSPVRRLPMRPKGAASNTRSICALCRRFGRNIFGRRDDHCQRNAYALGPFAVKRKIPV